jgi:hypothetical protein
VTGHVWKASWTRIWTPPPKLVPLAKNVQFTENGQKLAIPDGLWNSMLGKGTYRLFVDDPEAGSVAFIGTFVVRNPQTAERLEKIGAPNRLFLQTVPEAQRMSRADLIKTANMHFSGMQQNDGKGVYPFSDDCNRIEMLHLITRIRDRRYVALDAERGLVFSFIFFDRAAGKTRHFETPSGRAVVAGPWQP